MMVQGACNFKIQASSAGTISPLQAEASTLLQPYYAGLLSCSKSFFLRSSQPYQGCCCIWLHFTGCIYIVTPLPLLIRLCFLLLSLSLADLIQVIGIVLVRLFMLSKMPALLDLYFMMYYLPDLNEI